MIHAGDFFDQEGRPISMEEWAAMFKDTEARRIGLEEFDGVEVSTVWLGIDHGFGRGSILIFETMIFGGEFDQEQWRYTTKEEAVAGHASAVHLVKASLIRQGKPSVSSP